MSTYPHIITNSDGYSITVEHTTFGVKTMPCRIDADIRTNETIVTDVYFCNVEHRTIIISMEIVADMDILAKVTMEIITNERITTRRSEQFLDNFLLLDIIDQSQTI